MSEASLSCSSHAVLGAAPGAVSAVASVDHGACPQACACAADACSGGGLATASGASQPCSAPGGCKLEVSDTALSVQTCHLDGLASQGLCSPGSSSCCPSPAPCSAPLPAAPAAAGDTAHPQGQHNTQQQLGQGQSKAAAAAAAAPYEPGPRDWQYHLVTFPAYFTPCAHCCGSSKPVKREQLLTLFDLEEPSRVYCSHCPEAKLRGPALLQVRRSAFKDVVKATDLARFGADAGGVQQYTLNGSKVIYLNREALVDKKGTNVAAAPATCAVDGRAMMDKTSLYCSLKCKMTAEDPGFTAWLAQQDPALLAAANAAANAPPRPTVACKRTAPSAPSSPTAAVAAAGGPSSSGSGCSQPGGGSSSSAQRPKKAARVGDAGSPAAAAAAGGGSSSGGAAAAAGEAVTTTRRSAAAAAAAAGKSGKSTLSGPSAFAERAASAFPSLPRIRTSPSSEGAAGGSSSMAGAAAAAGGALGVARYSSAPAGLASMCGGGGSSNSLMVGGSGASLDAWGCSSGPCSDPYAPWGGSSEEGDALLASPMLGCHPLASPGCHSLGSSLLDCSSPRLVAPGHNSSSGCAAAAAGGAGAAAAAAAGGALMGGSSSEWWLPTSPVLGALGSRLQSAPAGGLCSPRLLGAPYEAPLSALTSEPVPLGSCCELDQLSVLPTGPSLSLGSGTSLVTSYLGVTTGDGADGVSLLGCPGEVQEMFVGEEDLYNGIVAAH